MTPLKDARAALHKLVQLCSPTNPDYAPMFAALLDYLDNQVPLNIEIDDLRARLAHAEGFMSRVEQLASETRIKAHLDLCTNGFATVQNQIREVQQMGRATRAPIETCVAHLTEMTGAICACTVCRVRANA